MKWEIVKKKLWREKLKKSWDLLDFNGYFEPFLWDFFKKKTCHEGFNWFRFWFCACFPCSEKLFSFFFSFFMCVTDGIWWYDGFNGLRIGNKLGFSTFFYWNSIHFLGWSFFLSIGIRNFSFFIFGCRMVVATTAQIRGKIVFVLKMWWKYGVYVRLFDDFSQFLLDFVDSGGK